MSLLRRQMEHRRLGRLHSPNHRHHPPRHRHPSRPHLPRTTLQPTYPNLRNARRQRLRPHWQNLCLRFHLLGRILQFNLFKLFSSFEHRSMYFWLVQPNFYHNHHHFMDSLIQLHASIQMFRVWKKIELVSFQIFSWRLLLQILLCSTIVEH